MNNQKSKLAIAYDFLRSAESALASAREILSQCEEVQNAVPNMGNDAVLTEARMEGNLRIIEGAFDGQNMVGSDQRIYPVPANYASKSKLIPGDKLKLTITETGTFKYKQIGPIPRREIVGVVTYTDGEYHVLVDAKLYRVLLASITYYKAEVGSKVTIIVPLEGDSEWCAIEHLLPA